MLDDGLGVQETAVNRRVQVRVGETNSKQVNKLQTLKGSVGKAQDTAMDTAIEKNRRGDDI